MGSRKTGSMDMAGQDYMALIGLDCSSALTGDALHAFRDGLSRVHVPDVVDGNPGVIRGTSYERISSDPNYESTPRWLALYHLSTLDSLEAYGARLAGESGDGCGDQQWSAVRGDYTWRLLWRRTEPADSAIGVDSAPYLRLVGTDLPATDAAVDLEEFHRFYTQTHLPQVVRFRQYLRGARYELHRDLGHPAPGGPGFLAAYEGDEACLPPPGQGTAAEPQPELTVGPAVWQRRKVRWYSMFRRISSYVREA